MNNDEQIKVLARQTLHLLKIWKPGEAFDKGTEIVADAIRTARLEALREAARAVCIYCKFPDLKPGHKLYPGQYWYHRDDADDIVICPAYTIWDLIGREAIVKMNIIHKAYDSVETTEKSPNDGSAEHVRDYLNDLKEG